MGKLINRIPGSRLLISSLQSSALRTHVESLASLVISTSILKALSGRLDIKRHSLSIPNVYLHYTAAHACIWKDFTLKQIYAGNNKRNPPVFNLFRLRFKIWS